MGGQVRLNTWQDAFYDTLHGCQIGAFFDQLLVFLAIVTVLLALMVAESWLRQMLEVRLREWLTHNLVEVPSQSLTELAPY